MVTQQDSRSPRWKPPTPAFLRKILEGRCAPLRALPCVGPAARRCTQAAGAGPGPALEKVRRFRGLLLENATFNIPAGSPAGLSESEALSLRLPRTVAGLGAAGPARPGLQVTRRRRARAGPSERRVTVPDHVVVVQVTIGKVVSFTKSSYLSGNQVETVVILAHRPHGKLVAPARVRGTVTRTRLELYLVIVKL